MREVVSTDVESASLLLEFLAVPPCVPALMGRHEWPVSVVNTMDVVVHVDDVTSVATVLKTGNLQPFKSLRV